MKEHWRIGLVLLLISGIGYTLGSRSVEISKCPAAVPQVLNELPSEGTTVRFLKLEGDELSFSLEGSGRVIVDQHKAFEEVGSHQISLAAIPSNNALELRDFPFVGNAKTSKLYPADSYWARGTETKYRRFFQTIEEGIQAGFVPVKSLK